MRRLIWALLVIGVIAGPVRAAEPDLQAEQARLEAGDDLGSRARRALFRARGRQDAGEFAEAAAIMNQWLAGDVKRDHHLLRFNLAVSYLGLEQPAEALPNLERAVELAPRFGRAWLRLGEAAYGLAQFARAGEAFSQAYDLSPDHQPEILYYAGVSLLSGGEPGAALERLTRLVGDHPTGAEFSWYQALVAAAVSAGQAARAVPYLDQLLLAGPDDPAVWDLAYRYYAGENDYEQAAVLLTVGGYLAELDRTELEQLGDLYNVIGVPLQAARYYERAFTGDTEPAPDEYRKLATAWLAAHETDRARGVLQAALAARPTRGLWALLGDLEYTVEDYEAGLAAFRSSTALDPEFGRGYLMMGYCALELGREAEARAHLARAAEFAAQKETARALLGRLGAG